MAQSKSVLVTQYRSLEESIADAVISFKAAS